MSAATMPPKPAEMSAAAVSAATSAAAVSAATSAATVSAATSAATSAAGVCFECEKGHDEEQHRGHASAGRQHRSAPHRRGRLSVGIPPRTKSF
jgi:hypothetical protein